MKSMQRDKILRNVIGGFIEWGIDCMHPLIPYPADDSKVMGHVMERRIPCILRDISKLTTSTDMLRRSNMVDPSYVPFLLPLYVEFDTVLFKFIMGELENQDEVKDQIYERLYDFANHGMTSSRGVAFFRGIESMLSEEHRDEFYSRVSLKLQEKYDSLFIRSEYASADVVTERAILSRVIYEIITRDDNDDIFESADGAATLVIYKNIADACKALIKQEFEPSPSRWIVRLTELSKDMNKPDCPDVRKVLVSRLTK